MKKTNNWILTLELVLVVVFTAPILYAQTPIYFEKNTGHFNPSVEYVSRLNNYLVSIKPERISFQTKSPGFDLNFLNCNSNSIIYGEEQLEGIVNYIIGNDKTKWKTNIPTFNKVRYQNIYDDIDLLVYTKNKNIEYDLIVKPGANPNKIKIKIDIAKQIYVNDEGNVVIITSIGDSIIHRKPTLFQESDGIRQFINGECKIYDNIISFKVSDYRHDLPLIIDPELIFSTFIGGTDGETIRDIAVDVQGNIYAVGHTSSPALFPNNLPSIDNSINEGEDAFVFKLNQSGTALIYGTYLGGRQRDYGTSIKVDHFGYAYVCGITSSTDDPTTNTVNEGFPLANALQPLYGGGGGGQNDAFISKISIDGSELEFSTYFGGEDSEATSLYFDGPFLALDDAGNLYITGNTTSNNFFPVEHEFADPGFFSNAFVSKISSDGSSRIYTSSFGNLTTPQGISVDLNGNIIIAGYTGSLNLPTVNAIQGALFEGEAGNLDAFVLKMNNAGNILIYSTYLGGNNTDQAYDITTDLIGNAYITGRTASSDDPTTLQYEGFPIHNALQQQYRGGDDAFVAKIRPNGSLEYSTYLGGEGSDHGLGIAVDGQGITYVVGYTESIEIDATLDQEGFPTILPLQSNNAGIADGFVTQINPTGTAIEFSSYYGGSSYDGSNSVIIDYGSNIIFAGVTQSNNFPIANPFQSVYAGSGDGYVVKISAPPQIEAHHEYPAKFVCGEQSILNNYRLLQGVYGTTINIHNPNDTLNRYYAKLALSYPPIAREPGGIYTIGVDQLQYDQAIKIDCDRVRRELFPQGFPSGNIEGFVVLQSELPLDIAGVYTSGFRGRRRINTSSIDIEYIPERDIDRVVSLVADIKIVKTARVGRFATSGTPVDFNISITNDGPISAQNVMVYDLLEVNQPGILISLPNSFFQGGGAWTLNSISQNSANITVSINDIHPGETRNLSFRALISALSEVRVVNNISTTSITPDPVLSNNVFVLETIIGQ